MLNINGTEYVCDANINVNTRLYSTSLYVVHEIHDVILFLVVNLFSKDYVVTDTGEPQAPILVKEKGNPSCSLPPLMQRWSLSQTHSH